MKESTLAKITASVAAAKGIAQKALAAGPNPEWTEQEIRSIDEWIASEGLNIDRPEAIRRLVELGLKAKPIETCSLNGLQLRQLWRRHPGTADQTY